MYAFKNLILLFILSSLLACGIKKKSQEEIEKNWKTFETNEFSVKYPPSWIVNESGYMGTRFLIIAKQTSIRDYYQENVSLIKKEVHDSINLEQYVQLSLDSIKNVSNEFQLVESQFQTNNDKTYYKVIFNGQEGINNITYDKYYQLKNNMLYILTFSGKTIELTRYQPLGEGIMNSFTLK